MGNEYSSPTDLKVEGIIKVSDDWVLKSAFLTTEMTQICIFEQHFREENIRNLQLFSKNLKVYRHPNILKYISSWRTNRTLFVATEFAQPLSVVIRDMSPMQLCVGLFGVLKALIFIHEMASSSHNNTSKDAIYVTSDGSWKLGGLELMTRREQGVILDSFELNDQRGFANLATEILRDITSDVIPGAEEFKQLCEKHAASTVPDLQFFRRLFNHSFFSHRFLCIYNFLFNLPGKNEAEKTSFFETLADDLLAYPEEMVASILTSLLLSRLVALNITAQERLFPKIFLPKTGENSSLFSIAILQKYIAPRLLKMFSVRDSQIRFVLLRHFKSFYVIFTKEQLQNVILPELLVGIKDTNETLVSDTLHTLADLIPVLGASVVIGKDRVKLFADGRPFIKEETYAYETTLNSDLSSVVSLLKTDTFSLPERLSPDGGEDVQQKMLPSDVLNTVDKNGKLDPEDIETNNSNDHTLIKKNNSPAKRLTTVEDIGKGKFEVVQSSKMIRPQSMKREEDLMSLDVKCSRSQHKSQIDNIELIFKDMEPVISRTAVMEIPKTKANIQNKFTAAESAGDHFDGWGDEIQNEWISSDTEV